MSTSLIIVLGLLAALSFPLDLLRRRRPQPEPDARIDERDVMFSRAGRTAGTPAYEEYYARRPELKADDDRIRAMTPLMKPGARHYDPVLSREAEQYFIDLLEFEPARGDVERLADRLRASRDPDRTIREMIMELGAVGVGCTALTPAFIYTRKGRFDHDYGTPVELDHPHAILFLVEMEFEAMQRSPLADVIRESARQYRRGTIIARTVTAALLRAGWNAKAHYDAHWDLILPPLAAAAGLGEVGRNNILIADRYGSRVRIGAVTTDLEVRHDSPVHLGADHFCRICRKCAENCPSGALQAGGKTVVNGVEKWTTGVEQCYAWWRLVGTDCGICMAVCPFSHRDNWFHNLVRSVIRLNPWLRHLALLGDDLIYGRKWKVPAQETGDA
jgi:ferredoxin